MALDALGITDYAIFCSMFILYSVIGIFYGFFKGKISKTEYLIGNKNMNIFPVALSIVASGLSSTMYIGRSTEAYLYGSGVFYTDIAAILVTVIFIFLYLPVLYGLETTTLYEYLLLRFDRKVHMLATTLITLQMVFVTPVVLYVPALVFNEVTGINFYVVTIATCLICIFYTCVGGFTAVIYTDMIQTIVMILALLITNIKGTDVAGGLQSVWRENYNSGRMDFVKTDIDVTLRYTIWAIFIGYSPNMMAYGCLNQGTMQRYRSVSSLNSARKLLVVYIVFGASLFAIIAYSGLMLYANYHDCDPLTTQVVKKKDQILTFFVRSTLADVTGLTGLFLAGVFSAGLRLQVYTLKLLSALVACGTSTISTTLNSLSGVLLQDFYISLTKKQISEDEGSRIMKIFVIILGIIVTGMTLVVDKMGTIYQISASLSGLINGPIVGIFTIGIFLPTIRGKAVLIGTTLSFLFTMWMYIGSLIYPSNKLSESKSFSVDGCTYNFTLASLPTSSVKNENVFLLYKVSFFWYAFIGFSLTIIISVFMSIFMERNDTSSMDPKLFSHLFRRSSSRNKKESGTPAVEMKLLK